jgi:hypothetical protein
MLSEESASRFFVWLREQVGRLASDPEVQKAYLQELGTWDCLDELAEEFDTYYTTLLQEGRLRDIQLQTLDLLDAELRRISGQENAPLWYGAEALHAPEWSRIRQLAKDALRSLDLDLNQAEG